MTNLRCHEIRLTAGATDLDTEVVIREALLTRENQTKVICASEYLLRTIVVRTRVGLTYGSRQDECFIGPITEQCGA